MKVTTTLHKTQSMLNSRPLMVGTFLLGLTGCFEQELVEHHSAEKQREKPQQDAITESENNLASDSESDVDVGCQLQFSSVDYTGAPGDTISLEWDDSGFAGSEVFIALVEDIGAVTHFIVYAPNNGQVDVTLPMGLDPNTAHYFYIESAENGDRTGECHSETPLKVIPVGHEEEICNCEDDDGDGLVDEGLVCRYPVDLNITADDSYVAYANGVVIGSDVDWQEVYSHSTMLTAGTHTIAAEVQDLHNVYIGMIASIDINGQHEPAYNTGTGTWQVSNISPPLGWQVDLSLMGGIADDSALAASCDWGSYWPADLLNDGAQWIFDGSCNNPSANPENYYAVEIQVCPDALEKPEICNCEDDDGDGLVDEGIDCEYEVNLEITADDYYKAFVNDVLLGLDNTWQDVESYVTSVPAGVHRLNVMAQDQHNVVAGLIANLNVDGIDYPTGYGDWMVSYASQPSTWMTTGLTGYQPDNTALAGNCLFYWGAQAPSLTAIGAEWVWAKDCTSPSDYPVNLFQMEFSVCPEAIGSSDESDADEDIGTELESTEK